MEWTAKNLEVQRFLKSGDDMVKIKVKSEKVNKGKGNSSPSSQKISYQLNLQLAESLIFNRGFTAGAKEQRETDIQQLVDLLETLEEIPGIGGKTAWKVREMFLSRFGKEEKHAST